MSRAAFDRLVVDHLAALQRFAVRLTGDVHAGEEVAQETLLRASKSWRTFRGRGRFSAWLMRIGINVFRDRLRKSKQTAPLPEQLDDVRARDPVSRVMEREVGERVGQAVSGLPPRQREVLVLRFYEALSTAETAELLGISQQNVRMNVYHARQSLRKQLADLLEDNRT